MVMIEYDTFDTVDVRTDQLKLGWEVSNGGGWCSIYRLEPMEGNKTCVLLSGGDGIVCEPHELWRLRPTSAVLHYPDGQTRKVEL